MDVTALAIGVTVTLAVGILILLVVFAAYFKSRRRVDKLRELATTSGKVQRGTSTSQARLSDNITDVLQDRRRAAASGLTKFESFRCIIICQLSYGRRRRRRYQIFFYFVLFIVRPAILEVQL